MNELIWFLVTLAVAAVGGLLFHKIRFPAGTIVGAILFVGAFNILTGLACMPTSFKPVVKAITGLFVGMNITADMVRNLKRLIKPTLMLVVLILSLCFGMGILLYLTVDLDIITALFCMAPGGLTDMTLMTMDMGGDAAIVAVLQTMRLLSAFCISMPLAKVLVRWFPHEHGAAIDSPVAEASVPDWKEKQKRMIAAVLVTITGGTIGHFLGELLDFSVMVLVGAMIASAAVNIKTGKLYMPGSIRKTAQILCGALIGVSVTYESIRTLKLLILPALIICIGFILVGLVLAVILHKTCKMDMPTAMLSCIAGGASEISLIAGDFDADAPTVAILQISRMVCTTLFYPILVKLLSPLLMA